LRSRFASTRQLPDGGKFQNLTTSGGSTRLGSGGLGLLAARLRRVGSSETIGKPSNQRRRSASGHVATILNFIELPRPPTSGDEIVELFENALTPQTRIIVFSHMTWETGLLLPAKEICALARRHGVLTHIDGAHGIGHIPRDLHDLGCDFYATNGHKWLMSPKGSGLLFIREEHLERLWANTVGEEWRNYELKAYRFSNLGTSNLSVIVGVKAALDFVNAIGPERIYARIHELGAQVRDRLRAYNKIRLLNASSDAFHSGLVSFAATRGNPTRVLEECQTRHIRVRYWDDAGGRIRSPHIFSHNRSN
jgi:selenocysteine lyase/cysteine desulfurase